MPVTRHLSLVTIFYVTRYLSHSFKPVHHLLITIDVEDWFQVENLRPWMPFSTWDSRELRVEANVNRLLDLFDSFKLAELQAEDGRAPCAVRRLFTSHLLPATSETS